MCNFATHGPIWVGEVAGVAPVSWTEEGGDAGGEPGDAEARRVGAHPGIVILPAPAPVAIAQPVHGREGGAMEGRHAPEIGRVGEAPKPGPSFTIIHSLWSRAIPPAEFLDGGGDVAGFSRDAGVGGVGRGGDEVDVVEDQAGVAPVQPRPGQPLLDQVKAHVHELGPVEAPGWTLKRCS